MGNGDDRLPSPGDQWELLRHVARYASHRLSGRVERPNPGALSLAMSQNLGCFVTWREAANGELRGCMGITRPGEETLARLAERMAVAAALDDPRFAEVRGGELEQLTLGLSLLTPETPWPIPRNPADLRVGEVGLRVEKGGASGVLLPQVATAWRYDGEAFLRATCRKAGIPEGAWRDSSVAVFRFHGREIAGTVVDLLADC